MKLRPCKATVVDTLQPCNQAGRVHFCSWFLWSVDEGDINLQLTGTAFSAPPVIYEL
jgi:pyrimidine deaminase RibD-like protein